MTDAMNHRAQSLAILLAALLALAARADDTEIYFDADLNAARPNVLFILDTSGSMARAPDGSELPGGADNPGSRYQIMKRALLKVLQDVPDSLNVGLVNYGGHGEKAVANGIRYPVTPISDAVRAELAAVVDGFKVGGYTPIVQALYEAARYFRGMDVDYGLSTNPERQANPASYEGGQTVTRTITRDQWCNNSLGECAGKPIETDRCVSGPTNCQCDSFDEAGNCTHFTCTGPEQEFCPYPVEDTVTELTGAKYKRPITAACQRSFIVLLSDGEPDDGHGSPTPGNNFSDPIILNKLVDALGINQCQDQPAGLEDGRCGPELTAFLAGEDQVADLEGRQTIGTFTVGFAVGGNGQDYLRRLANLGPDATEGDGFFTADNEDQLVQAFARILTDINATANGFTPPALEVDPEDGLTNNGYVYLSFFRPARTAHWLGNLKKYRFDLAADPPVLRDRDGHPVLDADGRIVPTARGFWLAQGAPPDGGDITAGGAAHRLGAGRHIFTDDGGGALVPLTPASVPPAALGLAAGDPRYTAALRFLQGLDPATGTAPRHELGDILHGRPVVVHYGGGQSLVFVGTNEGYLHAFDTADGSERFAFIPRALLPNVPDLLSPDPDLAHPYGLDGPITVWRNDIDGDGAIEPGQGEFVYLYVGMRRGGRNYYALDVTNPDAPRLLWVIRGGEGDFARLGQTWSAAVPARLRLGNAERDVLVFSGGYDPNQDPRPGQPDTRRDDSMGNALYVVDARTGARLWWLGPAGADLDLPALRNSIPASPRVLDVDGNGIADRIYLADTGGRVFRIDLPDPDNRLVQPGNRQLPQALLLADLGGDGVADNRRFYHAPDVALQRGGGRVFFSIALGSGWRAHPLAQGAQTAQDRLYVLRDSHVYGIPLPGAAPIGHAQLRDVTQGSPTDLGDARGWYIDLRRAGGEKALARAVTVAGRVFFTTFEPNTTPPADVCAMAGHTGRIYALDARSGRPVINFHDLGDDDALDLADRALAIATQDILPEVTVSVTSDEGGRVRLGIDVGARLDTHIDAPVLDGLLKVYWEGEE